MVEWLHYRFLVLRCTMERHAEISHEIEPCIAVERRLLKSGVVVPPMRREDDSDDDSLTPLEHLRQKVYRSQLGHDSADEDSDFD